MTVLLVVIGLPLTPCFSSLQAVYRQILRPITRRMFGDQKSLGALNPREWFLKRLGCLFAQCAHPINYLFFPRSFPSYYSYKNSVGLWKSNLWTIMNFVIYWSFTGRVHELSNKFFELPNYIWHGRICDLVNPAKA